MSGERAMQTAREISLGITGERRKSRYLRAQGKVKNTLGSWRRKYQLTQIQVATALGVSRLTLIGLERGARPSVVMQEKLCAFYEVPARVLWPEWNG